MALQNIRKKFNTYTTYFISATFAVTVFFIFCSIYYNKEFEKFHTAITKIGILFKLSSILVFVFSAVFVYYANSLFIKSRKKEIAIYSLLGMRKREIGELLFVESFLIGMGSILSGIMLGCLFSRFFSLILIKMMLGGAPGNKMVFELSWQPFILSAIVFMILFMLNAVNSFRVVKKSKLIELLSAEKEGEKPPRFSVKSSILAVAMIVISYAIFLNFNGDSGAMKLIGPAMFGSALMAVGTYLLFHNLIILIFSRFKNNINIYYRTDNFISLSQLVYRIKANSNLFSVIALLSAFTVTIMSSSISAYQSLKDSMPIYAPFSFLCDSLDEEQKKEVYTIASNDQTAELYTITDFSVLKTIACSDGYQVDTNSGYGKIRSALGEDFTCDIITFNDYKRIIHDTKAIYSNGNKGAVNISELKNGYCLFLDGNYSHEYCDRMTGDTVTVDTDLGKSNFKIEATSLYKYMGAKYARTTLVVNDDDFEKCFAKEENYDRKNYYGIRFNNPLYAKDVYDKLDTVIPDDKHDRSYLEYHQLLFNQYGASIFIGVFLGILFLLAAGSIIFYKQMMEARDDVGRYEILKNVGMSKKEVLLTLKKQVGIVFLLPFVVAMMHSVIILITYRNLVYTITTDSPILVYVFSVTGFFAVIYLIFYIGTVKAYMKTVWR